MDKKISHLFGRYILIILVSLGNLFLFYKLFTIPTIAVSSFLLSFFRETIVVGNYIIFGDSLIQIAKSCVSGAAYFLLFALSMSIPLELKKRIKLISFLFASFFLVNILRIFTMSFLLDFSWFDSFHFFVWNVLSTFFVIGLWFLAVHIFKIKEIPFYTDFKSIKNLKKPNGKTKHNNSRKKNSKGNR